MPEEEDDEDDWEEVGVDPFLIIFVLLSQLGGRFDIPLSQLEDIPRRNFSIGIEGDILKLRIEPDN